MIFHLSIDADDPRHVAEVIAELWGGIATPFPPVTEGSWMAMAGDERNTTLEVYPRGTVLVEGEGDTDAYGVPGGTGARSATHFAMGTALGVEQVIAIARREGWPVKYRKRGDIFGVLEIWVEGTRMIEVLTPEMQAEYRETMTVAGWNRLMQAMGAGA
ncbi:hypothetical protein ACFQ1E_08660 [Sphingomonas canadensis]|uniref:VOC domain-containing protein n=2 Tax=Sphingomonas canadensis TaxID=1219257 RepID=A0ABW3H6V8_9SPHN